MKKIFVSILLLFLLTSCYLSPEQKDPLHTYQYSYEGCKIYSNNRIKYQSCIKNMFQIWQTRENADLILSKIDSTRFNDKWIETKYSLCRADECFEFVVPEYDPTLMYTVRNDGGFVGLGMVLFWLTTL